LREWPLVIFCPPYLRYMWRYELLKWLPGFDIKKIKILSNDKDKMDGPHSIYIMSYEIASKL
jgi:hypothetical protein